MKSVLRFAVVFCLGVGIGAGVVWKSWADRGESKPAAADPRADSTTTSGSSQGLSALEQRRFAEILGKVRRDYVDEIPTDRLLDAAMRGMVSSLDPYSDYLNRREYEELRRAAAGNYPGIGIEVVADGGFITVLRPIEDSPAQRAGIRRGDVILRIDDEAVGPDVVAAIEQMRGPPGSLVRLTLRRSNSKEIVNVSLERARVAVQSVTARLLEPGFAYVRITGFSETTAKEFERQVAALRAAGRLRGVVLDLRNNPGGVLEGAVAVADAVLETGVIVSGIGRSEAARFRMTATAGDFLAGVPMAVLVDGMSASAAEILAGALKDQRRAKVYGRRTYGKGSVQTVIPLADGHALKLTTSRYATPSGALINNQGIEPDRILPESPMREDRPDRDPQVLVAWRDLRRSKS